LFRDLLPVVIAGLVPFAVLMLIVLGTAFSLIAWQPPILQTTQFGTTNSDNGITAIASDRTGVYATGFVGYRNVTPTYLFLNKYDLNGREVWSDRFDNPYRSEVSGIALGDTAIYIVGISNESSYVREYDFNGSLVWNEQIGNWSATSVSVTTAGVYVGGSNSTDYFVREYTLNGTLIWTSSFPNSNIISVYADIGGVYVNSANTIQKLDANSNLVWALTCTCGHPRITGDSSSIYVAGIMQTGAGTFNGYLAKYNSNGGQEWNRTFSAPGFNSVNDVEIVADSSGVYLAETTTGEPSGIVMQYDSNGNQIWSIKLPWKTGLGSAPNHVIAMEGSVLYVAGNLRTAQTSAAFLTTLDKSSSLIFFGLNPPFSFVLAGLLVAGSTLSILWFRRQRPKKRGIPRARGIYLSEKTQ